MARITTEDLQALMNIRNMIIQDHERILDVNGFGNPAALCKQADVADAFSRAIKALEEVMASGGGIKFEKPTR